MMARGQFITVEGGEGTGKSTLIASLEDALISRGLPVVVTREPGGTVLAEAVRALVLSPPDSEQWSALSQTLLVFAARNDHLEKLIRPALGRGEWVISDRFVDSTRVYQRLSGAEASTITALDALVVGDTQPDLTLVLDGPVDRLLQRRENRGVSDVFETQTTDFHEKVREAYLEIARHEPDRCRVIDAMADPETVLADSLRVLEEQLAR
jgi:dTMP kinase